VEIIILSGLSGASFFNDSRTSYPLISGIARSKKIAVFSLDVETDYWNAQSFFNLLNRWRGIWPPSFGIGSHMSESCPYCWYIWAWTEKVDRAEGVDGYHTELEESGLDRM
jgi:hypothetical protein